MQGAGYAAVVYYRKFPANAYAAGVMPKAMR